MKTYFQASNNRNPTLEHSSSNIKNIEYSRTHQLQLDQAPLLAGGGPVLAAALRGEQLLQGGQPAPRALRPVEAIEAQVPALCRAEVDLEEWFDVIIFQCELR